MPVPAADSPAIRKLGPLFRLTEVHLWDDSGYAVVNDDQKHWLSAEDAHAVSDMDKASNKTPKHTDEANLSTEDLELANLMGSLGLPVSFSTSKVKKKTGNKGKKKGTQAPTEAAHSQIDNAVKACVDTEDAENAVQSITAFERFNSCTSSGTALGYSEPYHDDTDKILREGTLCVEEQESGCRIAQSAGEAPGYEAENQCELKPFEPPCNIGNPLKSEYPTQDNQDYSDVLQCSKEMLGHNSVIDESRHSCAISYQEENLCTIEYQISAETMSVPQDNNYVDREACLSLPAPSSVDGDAQSCYSNLYYDYGDWRVIWDQFYSRYYFYNIRTQESTWLPPEGLEDFASCFSTGTTKEGSQYRSTEVQENNHAGDGSHLDGQGQDHCNELHDLAKIPDGEHINQRTTISETQHDENIHNESTSEVLELDQSVASTKKKRRLRRSQSYHSCQYMAGNISADIIKYWIQRYSLFSLFDCGIKMDEEGWFSVTPELIAKHHVSRVGAGVMIDCFTGVGGNAIQFATKCQHVIAVDIDPIKIDCAQHNASVYGVNDCIDFVVADFIHIAPHLKGETAFMSPPWGGPDYTKAEIYDMKAMLKPCNGYSLFKLGTMIAARVVMFLPRNVDLNQLADMSLSVDPPWALEVEKNFLNGKLKAITAYFEKQDGLDTQQHG